LNTDRRSGIRGRERNTSRPTVAKWEAVREAVVKGKVVKSPCTIHWRGPSSTAAVNHFKLTTLFVESKGLFLEGNGGLDSKKHGCESEYLQAGMG
jgi:hypothetical protein